MRRFLDWLFRRKRGVDVRGMGKGEALGYKHEAERRLGIKWRGDYIRVRAEPGAEMSNDRPWLGKRLPGINGVATGYYSDDRITYFTTGGRVRPATGVHEWGHAVLHTHRVPVEEHHAVMRRHGIP